MGRKTKFFLLIGHDKHTDPEFELTRHKGDADVMFIRMAEEYADHYREPQLDWTAYGDNLRQCTLEDGFTVTLREIYLNE